MSQSEATFTIRSLIATAIGAIIFTVLVLELAGRIDHTGQKDNMIIGDFQAVHIDPGEEFRMSPKESGLHAVCENGYLAIAADEDPALRGVLVDYKNRGVRCSRARPQSSDNPSADTDTADDA